MATLAESFLADLDDLADESGEEEDLDLEKEEDGADAVRGWSPVLGRLLFLQPDLAF